MNVLPPVKSETDLSQSLALPPIQLKQEGPGNFVQLPPPSALPQPVIMGRNTSPLPSFPQIAAVAAAGVDEAMSVDGQQQQGRMTRETEMEEREKWYQQRLMALQEEMDSLTKGTHWEFQRQCKELDQARQQRVVKAEKQMELAMTNVRNIFDCERKMASDELEMEKANLKEKMMNFIMDQQKQIEDDKNHVGYSSTSQSASRPNTRGKSRRRPGEPATPTTNVTTLNIANSAYAYPSAASASSVGYGPAIHITTSADHKAAASKKRLPALVINYTLREDEVQQDLAVLSAGSNREAKRSKKSHH